MAEQKNPLLRDRDIEFILYEVLAAERLLDLPAFADHSRETFDLVLATARRLAREVLYPRVQADGHRPLRLRRGEGHRPPADARHLPAPRRVRADQRLAARRGRGMQAPAPHHPTLAMAYSAGAGNLGGRLRVPQRRAWPTRRIEARERRRAQGHVPRPDVPGRGTGTMGGSPSPRPGAASPT
ncbi:MAG: acyl-CoA dehydrogenase N-terminal domain-containing protein [Byssovorax sp.]